MPPPPFSQLFSIGFRNVRARTAELLGAISVWGLAAGIALDLLTFVVARYGPQGGDEAPWSFRGNGALVVPFGLGPVCMAAGWTALVLRARGVKRWRRWTVISGLVGVLIALASVGILISFGSAGQRASDWLSLAPPGWMLLAPAVATIVPIRSAKVVGQLSRAAYILAGVLVPCTLAAGFFLAELVLPPGA